MYPQQGIQQSSFQLMSRFTMCGPSEKGFAVDAYNDPLDLISNFKTNSYDLLLLDIKMPKMNGFELYNKLHQIDKNAKICSLLHMNFIMTNLRECFLEYLDCFICKPVSIDNFARVIKAELQKQDSIKNQDVR
jgi:two-component system catabolic regulation response regulator CreB/two-component system response regulator ChvI